MSSISPVDNQANKTIDLTVFLSNELCIILNYAAQKAMRSKNEAIDADHLFWALLNFDKQVINTLTQSAQFQELLRNNEATLKAKSRWRKKPNQLLLTPEVRKALLQSLIESASLKETLISPLAFLLALSKEGSIPLPYDTLVKSLHIVEGITIESHTPQLPDFIKNISDNINKFDQYIERPNYTDQIIRLLYKDSKKNILLVGNDGIGKTSTQYLLAKLALVQDNILYQSQIYSFDIGKVSLATLPEALNKLNSAREDSSQVNKNIAYLENIEINSNESFKEASLITPLFDSILSSNIWGIIPINFSQHQILLKSYPTLLSNVEIIYMEEPDDTLTAKIIETRYGQNQEIKLTSDTIKQSIILARRYVHDKFLPENTISLIDETFSQARIDKKSEITLNDIKKILAQKTGIPLTDLTSEEATDLQNIESLLKETVIGQDEAVEGVARTIKRSRAGLKDPKRPIGSFLFLGPSGTGKTQLAKALAKVIYKDENAMIRIDMSEYTDSHTVDRLIGAPPGYVGYEEGGQLTNKVLKKPYSLILLDEVEKANPKVFDIFLQVLDDGRLTDGQGKTVDFKNTIIIMTSNLKDEDNLNEFFRPEFLNRIDQIIHFKPLTVEIGKSIVALFVKDLQNRLKEKNITITVGDAVITQIAQTGISATYGARPLRRLVEEKIEDPIVEKIISGEIKPGENLTWDHI